MSAQPGNLFGTAANDADAQETREWIDALSAVIATEGPERGHFLLEQLLEQARQEGIDMPFSANTGYVNTIEPEAEERCPGNLEIEERLRAYMRWNAMAMVVKANRLHPADGGDLGGHISSFASLATMHGAGFNHFWHAESEGHGGDCLYVQGHSSPGIYARAYLEGRLTEEQLLNFRQEVNGKGLSSYPHPKLMPEFWQFPTVSMGLGPLMGIYQARFLKYLHARGIANTENRKVWVFCGDGEMDEVESLGAIGVAAREKLDNLIFVVNCNLQRLDGPVRGNGKIIQELEGEFRGAGWNVIKLIWGSYWDPLLARDKEGILRKIMMETLDGDYQAMKANDGAWVRKHFFGRDPKALEMVAKMSDQDIWRLQRGGHDPQKVYAAFHRAVHHQGQPSILLIKTVKGFGMGKAGEGRNIAHQAKKMPDDDIRTFRDRFNIPIPDDKLAEIPFYKPEDDTPEMKYLHERRKALGGLPAQAPPEGRRTAQGAAARDIQGGAGCHGGRARDQYHPGIRPIPHDAAARQGTGSARRPHPGRRSAHLRHGGAVPADRNLQPRRPEVHAAGQGPGLVLQGRQSPARSCRRASTRRAAWPAGSPRRLATAPATASWCRSTSTTRCSGSSASATCAWAAGDMQARGFLLGGTSGRTTLNGEGLQHEDGHSHIMAGTIPNCVSYDPTFAHEVGVILHHGLKRMVERQENVYYYITLLNENYAMPGLQPGTEEQIVKGMYLCKEGPKLTPRVQLLGSGTILRESLAAQELLEKDWGVAAHVWSCPSFNELARDGQDAERYNLLHPTDKPRLSFVAQQLEKHSGPVVASTDYLKAYAEQIRSYIPKGRTYKVLGTDGFGRSDFRSKLREHFEINRHYIVLAALKALSEEGTVPVAKVAEAIKKYAIRTDKINPLYA